MVRLHLHRLDDVLKSRTNNLPSFFINPGLVPDRALSFIGRSSSISGVGTSGKVFRLIFCLIAFSITPMLRRRMQRLVNHFTTGGG